VRDLAPRVAEAGADVRVVCATDEIAAGFRALGVEAVALPLEHKLDARGAARLWPELEGADVIHTHDRRTGLLARPQGRLRHAQAVHTLHGVPDEIFARVGRPDAPDPPGVSRLRIAWLLHGLLRIEALLSWFGTVVVPSYALARFLVEHGFPAGRMHVIPNGIAAPGAAPPPPHDPIAIGTASVLEYRKGVDVLLDACARLTIPYRLEIFGDGPERQALERQATRLGVPARFHGFVEDLRPRLADVDLFVLPTRADNLPMAILEAMAWALPVVATRVGGNPELVLPGETGLLVEPERPAELAESIERLGRDPELRRRLGEAGSRRVATDFDATVLARRMLTLYEELCGSSR
jgi:glycosyltransferase involved in cell wall biosynthesis